MYPVRTVISALAMALGFTSSAFATVFSFTPIDVPGSVGTVAQDINNAGDIVGVFSAAPPAPVNQGYLLSGGTFTPIIVPGEPRTPSQTSTTLAKPWVFPGIAGELSTAFC
jgi:hypothetical protein